MNEFLSFPTNISQTKDSNAINLCDSVEKSASAFFLYQKEYGVRYTYIFRCLNYVYFPELYRTEEK